MKTEIITSSELIASCTNSERILLINPPVVEMRYQWIRWNQPLDLLKIGNFLRKEKGCEVRLYDFMLPKGGKVARGTNKPKAEVSLDGCSYPLWRYGESNDKFRQQLNDYRASGWHPNQVWITSLTSYWWIGVRSTVTLIKSMFPDTKVVIYGQYPSLETIHAQEHSLADAVVTDKIDVTGYSADFNLYENGKPSFCGLDARDKDWPAEVGKKFKSGISDFVFFNDDILIPEWDLLHKLNLLRDEVSVKSNRKLRFHALCGLYPSRFNEGAARAMKDAGFASLHFEQEMSGGELSLEPYKIALEAYRKADYRLSPNNVSGFLFIGLPSDDLEAIIKHMMNLLEVWGNVILKPYTPTPGSPEYQQYAHLFRDEALEKLSPHAFPFSRVNGIGHNDYDELYTLAAALNQKVRDRSFDTFPGTLAYQMIKTSLEREVWKLG